MRRACRQHENAACARAFGIALKARVQRFPSPLILVVRMDRETGEFGNVRVLVGIQCRTADDGPITHKHGEVIDLHLQLLPRSTHQDPVTF